MKISADTNIPFVKEAFQEFGDVTLVKGRSIDKNTLQGAEILLVRSVTKVDKNLLEGTDIKFVATATIGVDHVDTDYLKENGIGFASAPGSNASSVGEYFVTALINLKVKNNISLKDKTLGIVGYGNVGKAVYKRAVALGLKCLINDPPLALNDKTGFFSPLDKVLEQSDIVTVHVPLEKSGKYPTYKLINESFLDKIKHNAVLFNTSRGKVMDEDALKKYRSKLSGLVLDVWFSEPDVDPDTLKLTDIASPHIAGYSYDGKVRGTEMIYEAACRFFNKKIVWDPAELIKPEKELVIDLSKSKNALFDAVNTAYDIMTDDKNLRKITGFPKIEQGRYFDKLRIEYPIRREFKNYNIVNFDNCNTEDIEILKKLGIKKR